MTAETAELPVSNLKSESVNKAGGHQEATGSALTLPQSRNVHAIKAMFKGDYTGTRGVFLLMMDIDRKAVQRVQVVIASMGVKDEFRFSIMHDWKSFEDAVISLKLGGSVAHQMGMDVESYMKQMLEDDLALHVCECIASGNLQELRKIFVDIMSKAIADANVMLELAVEPVQATSDVIEASAAQGSADSAPSVSADSGAASRLPIQEIQLKVDPILAPVHGVPAKELRPGVSIIVEVKEPSALKQNVSKLLALTQSGDANIDKGTVEALVTEVLPAAYDRVTILMTLAPNIVGVANIFGDLRIKVAQGSKPKNFYGSPSESDAAPPGSISTQTFVMATVGILSIMALLAYLIFGVR